MFKSEIEGKPLEIETGKMATLANASCLVRYGETVVLTTVTMSENPKEGVDFFPLTVDFDEKIYSVGRIPGSFSRREGKPSEKAVLVSRLIDRSIRPLFPKNLKNEVAVVCTVLSVLDDYPVEIASLIGTSVALSISDIPWNGPIASSLVGVLDAQSAINPSQSQFERSDLHLLVSSTAEKVVMIEAGANQISNEVMLGNIVLAHKTNQKIVKFIQNIQKEIGKEKLLLTEDSDDSDLKSKILKLSADKIRIALNIKDKKKREKEVSAICSEVLERLSDTYIDCESKIICYIKEIEKEIVRNWIFEDNKRVDGRGLDQIRELSAEVGLLPMAHGSGMFTRGKTQVLTVATLALMNECQLVDGIFGVKNKYYMHHYNFPPYSVGETRSLRAPGRREIGHGALAEKALAPVIPPISDFPYTIRLVSEVLSSNGSTSQASVCGSTLALMDAGVPISAPVAGISCGLITKGDAWKIFVDIQGIEDFFGDMDFKVAGTKKGITAVQVDIKIDGLSFDMIKEALNVAQRARIKILDDCILKTIGFPRKNLSENAPKIVRYDIPVDKIRDVIGAGGKVVQKICSDFDVLVDIEDDGRVFVSSKNKEKCYLAVERIKSLTQDLSIGDVVIGKITRITNFGVFAEISPGKEGMCHISKLSDRRIERVTDILSLGDFVKFQIIDIDSKGRVDLRRISSADSFKN